MDLTSDDLLKHGIWRKGSTCDSILSSLLNKLESADKTVNIFIPEENHLETGDISRKLKNKIKEKNITINFLFGGFEKYKWTEKYDSPSDNMFLHLWPTSMFFIYTQNIIKNYGIEFLKEKSQIDYEFAYACLSRKAKNHRCYLIDLLVKEKILEKSFYTWHNDSFHPGSYEWKYTDPKKIITKSFDDNYPKSQNPALMPKNYFKSFIHLVSEGIHDGQFITEKTVIPLMHKKPFIVQGNKNFHFLLKDKLKFELYDEIFDYNFDDNESWMYRTECVVDNVKKIIDKDYKKLYEKLYPKLLYNQNRVIEIINQKIEVPEIVSNSDVMNYKLYSLKNGIEW